jgi:hypothetical protein
MPTTAVMIACCVLFGLPTPELFTSLYEEIEEIVATAVKALHEEIEERADKHSVRKREFLEEVLTRVISRNQSKKV